MASSKKTRYIGLSLWDETDRPERLDFLHDNELLESYVAKHVENGSLHLTAAEKKFLRDPFFVVTYTGNDSPEREFGFIFKPRLLIVHARAPQPIVKLRDGVAAVYAAVGTYTFSGSAGLKFKENRYVVSQQPKEEATDGFRYCLNEQDVIYNVIMIQ